MKTFLQTLDPMKMYFYQSDYDAFAKYKDRLADLAQQGDISFAYMVYNTFLDRIDERVKMIDQILASRQDFTVDEELVTDKDAVTYAKTPAEAYDRWRKRIKYDLLLLKAEKADSKTDKSEGKTPEQRLTQRYHSFAKRMHQTDAEELLEMYLTSLTTAFDPHTTYMSPSSVENFKIMMQLKLEGIGASLQGVDGYTVVKKIIPGGAAEKEGHLKLDDKIIAVGEGETRRTGRRRRHEAQRRGEDDPRQARHGRPPAGHFGQGSQAARGQDHAGDDRVEGQRGPGRGLRRRPPAPTASPTRSA